MFAVRDRSINFAGYAQFLFYTDSASTVRVNAHCTGPTSLSIWRGRTPSLGFSLLNPFVSMGRIFDALFSAHMSISTVPSG
jgi:hypothetical protein